MSQIEYNKLLLEAGRKLDQLTEPGDLLFMCRGKVSSRNEDITDALSLFKELEEQKKLDVDRVEVLKDLLKGASEWSLFQKVQKFEIKRKEYNDLLQQICREFDECNLLEQLIAICRRKTLVEFEGSIQNVRTLLKGLEDRDYLEFGRLDFLKEILMETDRQDLLKEVQDFEKRRNDDDEFERRKAQAARIVASAKVVGRQLIGVLSMKTMCQVAAAGITLFTVREILTRWSTYEQLVNCFEDCVLPAGTRLIEVGQGCVCFTVQADNLKGLTTLWNMYQDGTLKARLYDFLVTDEMRNRAGGEENVELTVTIEEEEYKKALTELIDQTGGNERRPQIRNRRHSDSVLSVRPKEDEISLMKLTRLENKVQLLEERVEFLEREITKPPLEFWETRRRADVVPLEQAQYVEYDGLRSERPLGEDRWHYVKAYVDNLQLETQSLMTDTADSGLGTLGAPSELGVNSNAQYVDYDGLRSERPLGEDKWHYVKTYVDNLQLETQSLMTDTAADSGLGTLGAPSELGVNSSGQSITYDEWKSVYFAAKTGNIAAIETILSRGFNINSKDAFGDTPLMFAARYGKNEIVHFLLEKGADLSAKNQYERNALHAASEGGNVAIIESMLSRGLYINSRDSEGDTPLTTAARCGKSEAVHFLLDKGADLSLKGKCGRNALHAASYGGNVAIIKTMLSLGLDINSKDSNGDTPLILAAGFGKVEAVHYLLKERADPFVKGRFEKNSLHGASSGGNVAIIESLLSRGLDVNSKDDYGDTPLILAAGCGKSEAVQFLLDKGADLSLKSKNGKNALHAASRGDNVAVVETMLLYGLDVNSKDSKGMTPLMLAARFGMSKAVRYLLHKGADCSMTGQFRRNALHLASFGGNVAIIETLLSRGLDINSKDSFGHTPLMIAEANGKTEAVNYLLSKGARKPFLESLKSRLLRSSDK